MVSVFFRKNQHFFKWYGGWFRKQLKKANYFFVQNEDSLKLLNSIGISHAKVSGDTRFDRVKEVTENTRKYPDIEKYIGARKVFLAGSSWPPEEEIIKQLIDRNDPDLCFIFAPHDISESHINKLCNLLGPKALRYSEAKNQEIDPNRILIIDSIGFLIHLYQYATYAFIGAGFGPGIHNILEAVCFGVPCFFGPNYERFREAVELNKLNAAFPVNNTEEFLKAFDKLRDDTDFYNKVSQINKDYIEKNTGAGNIIIDYLIQKL